MTAPTETGPDLARMSARELLGWLAEQRRWGASLEDTTTLIRCAAAAGVTNLAVVQEHATRQLRSELGHLTDGGVHDLHPPLTEADLHTLLRVGWRAFREDRDNVPDWATVARQIHAGAADGGWNHQTNHGNRPIPSPDLIDEFIRAGCGPVYARQMIAAAESTGKVVNAYGFTEGITPAAFRDLDAVGVPDRRALDTYRAALAAAGTPDLDRPVLLISLAIRLALDNVAAGPALAAARTGVPYAQWPAVLAKIPDNWFPTHNGWDAVDPVEKGALSLGFTFADLRHLADRGWNGTTVRVPEELCGGYVFARRGGSTGQHWDAADARRLADHGLTPDAVAQYAEALTVGSQSKGQPSPLLLGIYFWSDDRRDDVIALADLGVRPAQLTDYRYSGCRTVQDVLTAARAGIDGRRVKALRDQHGEKRPWAKSKQIKSLDQLLELHQATP